MDIVQGPPTGFHSLGLLPVITSVLDHAGLVQPTPIQDKAIPAALEGSDLIGIAQTGTGKTLAFALPLIQKLLAGPGRGLILVPTRELALQVEESVRHISARLNPPMRTICLIGGMPIYAQIRDLRYHQKPRVIIATPGRLQDHLNQKTLELGDVRTLILDEADRMLDMGFLPQIKRILESVPSDRQTMLFSATMSPEISTIAARYMHSPVRIEVARQGAQPDQIEQELCYVSRDAKPDLLRDLLEVHKEGPILVFSRTKHGASRLAQRLQGIGYPAAEIHSDRSLSQRRRALEGFKAGHYRILVATDVAARGIDVTGIAVVINFDLPDAAEDYIHRIGRTGRAGRDGLAISFATFDQVKDVRAIERLIGRSIPLSQHSEPAPHYSPAPSRPMGGHRGGRQHFGSRKFGR